MPKTEILKQKSPINIYDSDRVLALTMGIYSVKVIGGWDVELGEFSFSLTNTTDHSMIHPKLAKWRFNAYERNKRAKKIMVIDLPAGGEYIVNFKNQESLKVWNFPFPYLIRPFMKPINPNHLSICIG